MNIMYKYTKSYFCAKEIDISALYMYNIYILQYERRRGLNGSQLQAKMK